MKLFLFGGAESELGQFLPEMKLIEEVINTLHPKQVLHIPFCRIKAKTDMNRDDGRFQKNISIPGIEYLNAQHDEDIGKADSPLIFISGGHDKKHLMEQVAKRPKLLELIKNAEYIIGESGGSMSLGEVMRDKDKIGKDILIPGFGILKNTIIEPHYTEKNRENLLLEEMKKNTIKYGIGIDCATAIVFELDQFPDKYEKMGNGKVTIKKSTLNS